MKKFKQFLPLAAIGLIAMFVIISSAWMPLIKGCHKINAKGEGAIVGMAAGVITTEADIIGGGLLNGTTRAEFTFPVSPEAFTGTLVFTTKQGTLSFDVNGSFTGTQFNATAVATEGTGKLAGAEGTLVLEGVVDPSDGSFTENISGEICLD
jgi:hypothetical protein